MANSAEPIPEAVSDDLAKARELVGKSRRTGLLPEDLDRARQVAKLTPTERIILQNDQLAEQIIRERDDLLDEAKASRRVLNRLRPRNALLEQAHRASRTTGTLATIMMSLGSLLVGLGGAVATNDFVKWSLIASGATSVAWGCILSVKVDWFGWPDESKQNED